MDPGMIVVLAGGTGAAKLLRGLVRVHPQEDLCIVVNTADDVIVHGLHVSPDVDTVLYALAGMLSRRRSWGIQGDTFRCNERLGGLGLENWFKLGDLDMATHLYRTWRMPSGASHSQVTRELAERYGVRARVLPMTDDRVETRLMTDRGELGFQEYFVKYRYEPEVSAVWYEGAEEARPGPGILQALREAERILIAPSNPVTSIGPILAIPGVREAIGAATGVRLAISPFVQGRAVSGPADVLMRVWNLDPTPAGLAEAYRGLIDYLIIDEADAGCTTEVRRMGITPLVTRTVMREPDEEVALARTTVEALEGSP
jgi:LPPG:FO 2-phospho-L-lactate transferase